MPDAKPRYERHASGLWAYSLNKSIHNYCSLSVVVLIGKIRYEVIITASITQ